MNLNGDEKRIRRLFREMRVDDQRRAPAFAGVLADAHSGTRRSRDRSWRFAIAVATLCAALLIALVVIVRPSKPQGPPGDSKQAAATNVEPGTQPQAFPTASGLQTPSVDPGRATIKRARHRRHSKQVEFAATQLFAWKSPTASLLQTPDDLLLRSLPRLGESLQTIKSFSPDQFN